MKNVSLLFLFLIFLSAISCKPKLTPISESYIQEIEAWKTKRDSSLRAPSGYVNLAGLYWLKPGLNTFGADHSNTIVLPENAPAFMGSFILQDSTVTFITYPAIVVTADSVPVKKVTIDTPDEGPVMQFENFQWIVIERAGNLGIRLRDLESPATKEPLNIPYYELTKDWMITAKYEAYEKPILKPIENILGFTFDEAIKGELVFKLNGKTHRLLPLMDEDGIFIMFADSTSGFETYGAGRYLVAELPDSNNEVLLDFNKAYNPPCAYTDFATCPLPPKENILTIGVIAGEKYVDMQKDTNGEPI